MRYLSIPERAKRNLSDSDKKIITIINERGKVKSINSAPVKKKANNFTINLRKERGLEPGTRIGLLSDPHINWAPIILGGLKARCLIRPIDTELPKATVQKRIKRDKLDIVIADSEQLQKVDSLPVVSIDKIGLSPSVHNRQKELRKIESDFYKNTSPDDTAILMPTSGTTGEPKVAKLTHKNFDYVASKVCKEFNVDETDKIASVAPWHHIMGLAANLVLTLTQNVPLVYLTPSKKLLKDLPSLIKDNNVTIFLGLPKLFNTFRDRIKKKIEKSKIKSWLMKGKYRRKLIQLYIKYKFGFQFRFIASGSAPEDPETTRYLENLGILTRIGFGATETTAINTTRETDDWLPYSIGTPLPGTIAKIIPHEELNIDEKGKAGELLIGGPSVMKGYLNNPEATEEAIEEIEGERYFHTGDFCKIEHNQIIVKGRLKNIIVLNSGKNINPEEVENVLERLPTVKESLVKGAETKGKQVKKIKVDILPNLDKIRETGAINSKKEGFSSSEIKSMKEIIWPGIKKVQKELAPFERIKSKNDITIKEEEFEKTSTEKIKRHKH